MPSSKNRPQTLKARLVTLGPQDPSNIPLEENGEALDYESPGRLLIGCKPDITHGLQVDKNMMPGKGFI